jgi:HD superfamily phosphohydrolase
MYWQVYLHKTVLSAEFMLVNALKRAKFFANARCKICFVHLRCGIFCIQSIFPLRTFRQRQKLHWMQYAQLDDFDIAGALKGVAKSLDDRGAIDACSAQIMNRELFKIELQKDSD